MTTPPLLLADLDIHQWIWLAVVVISFLSWLVRQIKGDAAPPPARGRPADKPLRAEIEEFLNELTKGQPEPVRKPPAPPPRKPAAVKGKAEKPRKSRPAESPATTPSKPLTRLADQHLSTSALGQGVRAHVSGFMAPDRVTAEAQQHLGHRIEEAVRNDLGQSSTPARSHVGRAPHPLLALMSQPDGMRQAFILNEILQKPAALRRTS